MAAMAAGCSAKISTESISIADYKDGQSLEVTVKGDRATFDFNPFGGPITVK